MMLFQILLLVVGLALLIFSADWLVGGSSALAKRYNVSDLVIGLTIVSLGTSAPELVVNTLASFQNHHDIVYGNVIGSNNFNLFIILGIAGLISPIVVQNSMVWKEIPISFLAIIAIYLFSNDFLFTEFNILTRIEGFILCALFAGFIYYVFRKPKDLPVVGEPVVHKYSISKIWVLILAGLAGLIIGARLVVDNAVEIAIFFGVSEKIVALTIVAAGTSFPELATSVVASLRKNNDIAVGNVIGSNIFNLLFILAAGSIVKPIHFNKLFNTDIYMLAGGTIFLFLAMFVGKKKVLQRREAAVLLISYLAYTSYLVYQEL